MSKDFINGFVLGIMFLLVGILGNKTTDGQYAPMWGIALMLLLIIPIVKGIIKKDDLYTEKDSRTTPLTPKSRQYSSYTSEEKA